METKNVLKLLGILFIISIFFFPADSSTWAFFLAIGIVFLVIAWIKK